VREKNIKKPNRVANWEKKNTSGIRPRRRSDSGVARFVVIVRLVREVIFLRVIPRMYIKNSRGGQDGLGWRRWSGWCECE